jgi:TPR repeat protein
MQWRSGDPNTLTARIVNAMKQRMYGAPRPQAPEPTAGHTESSNESTQPAAAQTPADQKPASDAAAGEEQGTAPADNAQKNSEDKGKGADAKQNSGATAAPPKPSETTPGGGTSEKPKPQTKNNQDEDSADATVAASKPRPGSARSAEGSPAEDEIVERGQNYLYGKGVPRNCNQALMLLKSAASHGNPRASSQLGAMYATGNCVAQDRPTAYRWFTAASNAEPGNIYVERNRTMIWREMTDDERQRAR